MIVFFLAEDPESGRIIDDGFLPYGDEAPNIFRSKEENQWRAERRARDVCESWKINLIDYDGPYSEVLWRMGLRQPKWEKTQPPARISADRWANRFNSIDELKIYKAGIQAGRDSEPKSGRGRQKI